MPRGVREAAGDTLQIGEHAITSLIVQLIKRSLKEPIVIHGRT